MFCKQNLPIDYVPKISEHYAVRQYLKKYAHDPFFEQKEDDWYQQATVFATYIGFWFAAFAIIVFLIQQKVI